MPGVGNEVGTARGWARTAPAIVLVGLVPLAVAPSAASPFHAAKWALVCVVVPLGLLAAARTGPLRWPLRAPWSAWLGANVVATVAGVAPWLALVGSPQRDAGLVGLGLGLGAFVLGSSIGDDAAVVRRVVRASIATGGAVGLLAIADRLGVGLPGLHGDVTRARSLWGSATFAAGHLVLVGPLAVVHLRAADRRWRHIGLAAAVAMAVGLVLTGTRGAWLGALAATVVLVPALRRRQGGRPTSPDRLGLPLAAGVLVAIAAIALALAAVLGPTLERSTGAGRVDLWRTSLSVIADRPILGSGPDTQRVVLPSGIDDEFEQDHASTELHDRAHDLLLDTAVTTGLVGVAALAWLLGSIAVEVRRRLGHEVVGRAIAAGLVGYLVHLLFAFGDATLDPIAWFFVGLLLAALPAAGGPRSGDRSKPTTSGRSEPEPVTVRATSSPVLAGALGAVVLVSAAWGGGALLADHQLARAVHADAQADRVAALDDLADAERLAPGRFDLPQARARVAERLLQSGTPGSGTADPRNDDRARTAIVRSALRDLDRAEAIASGDPELATDRAALLDAAGRHDDALAAFRAVVSGPYPSSSRAWLGLGTAAANVGRSDEAIEAWERAATLDPRSIDALTNIALMARQAGRSDEAIDAFERVLDRRPSDALARRSLLELGVPEDELPDPIVAVGE